MLNSYKFWNLKIRSNYKKIIVSPIYIHKINIVSDILKKSSGKILDIGLGYGHLEDLLVKKNSHLKLYGIDISDTAIKNANEKYKGKFVVGRSKKLPFRSSIFDAVVALDVLEHLKEKDCLLSLREIYRVLKNDSVLIISVPINESIVDKQNNHHVQEYDLNRLHYQLSLSNFKITNTEFLTAFNRHYKLKSFVNSVLQIKKPNLLIVEACKI